MQEKLVRQGSQKRARFERLKDEITNFVLANHGCSAQSIVANLSHDKAMRNHGLTTRKVGFFISRNLAESLLGGKITKQAGECMVTERGCKNSHLIS